MKTEASSPFCITFANGLYSKPVQSSQHTTFTPISKFSLWWYSTQFSTWFKKTHLFIYLFVAVQALVIIGISAAVCLLTTLSLSAICTNGEVKGGEILSSAFVPQLWNHQRKRLLFVLILNFEVKYFSVDICIFLCLGFILSEDACFIRCRIFCFPVRCPKIWT